MQLSPPSLNRKLILYVMMLVALFHMFAVFLGFYSNDDINYARLAAGVAQNGLGAYHPVDQFGLRVLPVFMTAFFYRVFGIGVYSSLLYSLCCGLLAGLVLSKLMRASSLTVYFISLLVFFFSHSILFYMHRLLPDMGMVLMVLLMYYCYIRNSGKQGQAPFWGICFGLAAMGAVLTKETIIIVMPLFVLFFIQDIVSRRNQSFWLWAISSSAMLLIFYLGFSLIATGDMFYRYHILQSKNYFTICSFDQLPFSETARRIGYSLWKAMLLNGDMMVYIPAVAALIHRRELGSRVRTKDLTAFFVLLMSANFMSISFTHYVPLCQDPRHFIFLVPFAALLAGPLFVSFAKDPRRFIALPVCLGVATALIFFIHGGSTRYIYLGFFLMSAVWYLISYLPFGFLRPKFFLAGIVLVFLANYAGDILKPPYPFFKDHRILAGEMLATVPPTSTVFVSDPMSGELTEFFYSFKQPMPAIRVIDTFYQPRHTLVHYLLIPALNTRAAKLIDSIRDSNHGIQEIRSQGSASLYLLNDSLIRYLR